ncbi:PD40 domain-containing protein [bacterium]|nr:PD40 domain-containing protein [candidate division CSSED10-310 bacterium]
MASPLAHSLIGAAIYIAVKPGSKKQITAKGLVSTIVLANLMDGDFLISLLSGSKYHHYHVHTIAFALFASALVAMSWKWFQRRSSELSINSYQVFFFALLLTASHLLIDSFTEDTSKPYGCMLLWPISDKFYIFPYPVFTDIWRGTVTLLFGYHNWNAAIKELALGGVILTAVLAVRKWPVRWISICGSVSVFAMFMSFMLDGYLTRAAEKQLLKHLDKPDIAVSFSGEGAHGILFTGDRGSNKDIYCILPDGSNMRRLTDHSAEDIWPVWSPDGKWIAFQSNRTGNWDVYIMTSEGKTIRNLTNNPGADESPAWSKDGSGIVFSSDRSGDVLLYTTPVDGDAEPVPVTSSGSFMDIFPSTSPKDNTIAYTSRSKILPGWHIYEIPWNGGEPQRLSPQVGCRAKWSPDGNFLAFVSEGIEGATDIWIFKASGGGLRRLTDTPEYDYDPCWSPDGKQICFARGRDGKSQWELWTIGVDGQGLKLLAESSDGDRHPCWR